jgi:hypothetical protein
MLTGLLSFVVAVGISGWFAAFNVSILGYLIYSMWKLNGIYQAFDGVILKTLTDTTMIEKHKLFIDVMAKFSDLDRARKDKEYSELKTVIKSLDTELRSLKNTADSLRKDR